MIVARAIKPATPFKSSVFREELLKAAKVIEQDALKDFNKTTANWKHKVVFTGKIESTGTQSIKIIISTKDKIWGYVDEGTKPHIIKAKTRRGLLFKAGSKPKTTPDVVGTFPGQTGTDWVNKMQVKHPGTEPRNFTKHIAKTTQSELNREVKNALARAARRSGHSIKK